MDPYRTPELPSALATTIYLVALLAFLGMHRLAIALRARQGESRWAGTGRDLVTLLSLIVLAAAIHLLGVAGPLALLLSCTLTLVVTLIGSSRKLFGSHGWWVVLGAVLLLGLPIALAPAPIAAGAAALVQAIVPEVSILR